MENEKYLTLVGLVLVVVGLVGDKLHHPDRCHCTEQNGQRVDDKVEHVGPHQLHGGLFADGLEHQNRQAQMEHHRNDPLYAACKKRQARCRPQRRKSRCRVCRLLCVKSRQLCRHGAGIYHHGTCDVADRCHAAQKHCLHAAVSGTIHKGIRKIHRLHQKPHGDVTTGLFKKSCHQAAIDCV